MADLTAQALSEIPEIQTIRDTTLFLTSNLDQNDNWKSRKMPLSMLKTAMQSTNVVTTANTNANDYRTTGVYYFGPSYKPSNLPGDYSGWLVVFTGGTDYTEQAFFRAGYATTAAWVRSRLSGGWNDWKQITNDLSSSDFTPATPSDVTVVSPTPAGFSSVTVNARQSGYVVTMTATVTVSESPVSGWTTVATGLPSAATAAYVYVPTNSDTYGRQLSCRVNTSGQLQCARGTAGTTYYVTITYIATS